MIVFAYVPIFLVSFCLLPFFENPKKYWDCGLALVMHVLIGALLYVITGIQGLFFLLILPCLIMFAVGGYIFYAQHNFTTAKLSDDQSWDYLDAALNASSYLSMSRLAKWFTANIGYHHIHHVNSKIPFYRLPEVMTVFPEFQNPRTTSLAPREILRCLSLKLWDEQRLKLIPLKELKY